MDVFAGSLVFVKNWKKRGRVFNTKYKAQGGYHWSLHFTTFISVKKIDITAFIIRLSMIVRVNPVLNTTVVVDSYTVRTAFTRTIILNDLLMKSLLCSSILHKYIHSRHFPTTTLSGDLFVSLQFIIIIIIIIIISR